jgi:hypothetical protein
MKAMVQLTSDEVNALQYQVVVEMWKHIEQSGSKRRLYASTFDENERAKIKRWYTNFYKWYLVTGIPASGVVMSPQTLLWLQTKVIPFFGGL